MEPAHDNRQKGGDDTRPLERQNFQAVLWDRDGELVDSSPNYYRAYELVLRDAGIATNPREIFLREGHPTPLVLRAIFEQRGVPVSDSTIRKLVERRREYDTVLGERRFFDTVLKLLRRLREAGYRLGMVTGSSKKSVQRVLTPQQALLFDVVITADDVVRSKPHPDPFLLVAQALNVEPAKCLVIENAPFGIDSAQAAGCSVVAICTTLSREDLGRANWIVENHRELEALLLSGSSQTVAPVAIPAMQGKR